MQELSRRRLLQGAAATGIVGAVGPSFGTASAACRPGAFRSQVVILGGGMGGLTAAHELIERGFEVTVFESKALGGKARSIAVPGTGTGGRPDLPGEHGFRFFPGFYHHVPDTMRRIPLPYGGVVHDNLVAGSTTAFARAGRTDFVLATEPPPPEPQSLQFLIDTIHGAAVQGGTIPPLESAFFVKQLLLFLTSSEERRYGELEYTSWWDFVGAESRSQEYQRMLAVGATRNLVAAKAQSASARTIGRIMEALFTNVALKDQSQGEGPPDQVLNGPTNDAWIDPWVAHLSTLGVRFEVGYSVERLEMAGGRISGAIVGGPDGTPVRVESDWFVCAMPVERARQLWTPEILDTAPTLEGTRKLFVDWMNGIQFYLDRRFEVIRGHYSFVDSPWALTSLNQQQFWPKHDLAGFGDGRVRDILSVDISNWDDPGVLYGKPARECSREEIAQEVWAQIKMHLNDQGRETVVDDALLSWYLDPAIGIQAGAATTNAEPLLINTVGSWDDRPDATTDIPNLFLASDYVRTNIDLATMEGANEAARAAVNAIVEQSDSPAPPVPMFHLFIHPELAPMREQDAERYRNGQAHIFDTPELPSLPWPLEAFPELEVALGVVTPIQVRPLGQFPQVAATVDAAIVVRDDAAVGAAGADCDASADVASTRATKVSAESTAAGTLPATGRSSEPLLASAAAAAVAALIARRIALAASAEDPS